MHTYYIYVLSCSILSIKIHYFYIHHFSFVLVYKKKTYRASWRLLILRDCKREKFSFEANAFIIYHFIFSFDMNLPRKELFKQIIFAFNTKICQVICLKLKSTLYICNMYRFSYIVVNSITFT